MLFEHFVFVCCVIITDQPNLLKKRKQKACCKPSLSSIGSHDAGKIVQISGTVVRASPVRMYESERAYQCQECNHKFVVYADMEQSNNALMSPTVCPNVVDIPRPPVHNNQRQNHAKKRSSSGKDNNGSCKGTIFTSISRESVCTDYQEVKIQESASRIGRIGSMPRSLLIKLEHDLVDCCQPGDEIIVVGSLMAQWQPVCPNIHCGINMSLKAHSIRVANASENSWKVSDGTDDVRAAFDAEFEKYWEMESNKERPIDARNFICRAICPKLYGMHYVKIAFLLTLIGGSSDTHDAQGGQSEIRSTTSHISSGDISNNGPEQFTLETSGHISNMGGMAFGEQAKETWKSRATGYSKIYTRRREQSHILLVGDPGTGMFLHHFFQMPHITR
mmetsp:Transcript_39848/g.40478  ORF Transcript_39848/g.40478 Transcript_39848/m.40478 type:complete len:390 (+) Transcript_39848:84-1253(+)